MDTKEEWEEELSSELIEKTNRKIYVQAKVYMLFLLVSTINFPLL